MTIINKLASSLGRKDDKSNIELAKTIVVESDSSSIKELVKVLDHSDPNIASDGIKVLYEVGYRKPELIAEHVNKFIDLITSKNNRLVWGGMIAVQTVTLLKPKEIWDKRGVIINACDQGSVITMDRAIIILSQLSSVSKEYEERLFPLLIDYLKTVRIKSLPMYSENVLLAVNKNNKKEFIDLLNSKLNLLDGKAQSRIQKVIIKAEGISK